MNRTLRRILWWLPLGLVVLVLAAWLLLNAWLDGAGGRAALEAALAERLGLPVHLQGEFNVMLLPSIGVDGTELVIGAPGEDTEIIHARGYAVALALRPLLDRQMVVESFTLTGGKFYLERWPESDADTASTAGPLQIPEIRSLEIEDLVLLSGNASVFRILAFEIRDFVPGAAAPFELEVEGWGRLAGELRWATASPGLALAADWAGPLQGAVRVELEARLDEGSGSIAALWQLPVAAGDAGQDLKLEVDYLQQPGGVRFEQLRLLAGAQEVRGKGCLRSGEPGSLDLELEADELDVDALPDLASSMERLGAAASNPARPDSEVESGFGLNIRLAAGELRSQGAVARDAWLRLGAEPDCGGLAPALPEPAPWGLAAPAGESEHDDRYADRAAGVTMHSLTRHRRSRAGT